MIMIRKVYMDEGLYTNAVKENAFICVYIVISTNANKALLLSLFFQEKVKIILHQWKIKLGSASLIICVSFNKVEI